MKYILAIALSLWATNASALRCPPRESLVKEAKFIFIGKLVAFDTNVEQKELLLHYKVLEPLKGQPPDPFVIAEKISCDGVCGPEAVKSRQKANEMKDVNEVVMAYEPPRDPLFYQRWGLAPGDVHGMARLCAWTDETELKLLKNRRTEIDRLRTQRARETLKASSVRP